MRAADYLDPATRSRTIGSLAESLGAESRLLHQLVQVLRDQREGVARDDVEQVDDSVQAAHRVMQTLAEARRRRNALVHLLTDRRDIQVNALTEALGEHMTPDLDTRRTELQTVAATVSREVTLNRSVLTRAITTGNDYVRRLLVSSSSAAYGERGQWQGSPRESNLINQKV